MPYGLETRGRYILTSNMSQPASSSAAPAATQSRFVPVPEVFFLRGFSFDLPTSSFFIWKNQGCGAVEHEVRSPAGNVGTGRETEVARPLLPGLSNLFLVELFWFTHGLTEVTHQNSSIYILKSLDFQPPFFIGWFPNHHYFSRGLSSAKRNHHFFKWWLTSRVLLWRFSETRPEKRGSTTVIQLIGRNSSESNKPYWYRETTSEW